VTPGHRERAARLAAMDLAGTRTACGISLRAMGTALGIATGRPVPVSASTVQKWECGQRKPRGAVGAAYLRVITKLAAHLEIPE
jgi:DNA-binding transcriptional regulator YiaG